MLDYFILSLAVIVNLILGLVVFLKNKRSKQNISLFFIAVGIAIWCIGIAIFRADSISYNVSIFTGELVHFAAALIAVSFLFLSNEFPYRTQLVKSRFNIIFLILAIFIMVIVFIRGVVIKDVEYFGSDKGLTYGFGYILYSIYIFAFLALGFLNFIYKYFKSSGVKKLQLKYLFVGFFISAVIGIITNLLLPVFGIFSYNWLGPSSTIIMVSFISYSILKYRLLDIRFLITRTVLYIILIIIVTTPFIFIGIYSNKFFVQQWAMGQFFTSLCLALLIIFGLEPFKKLVSRITDKFLFKGKIDYQEVTKEISKIINKELKLENLIISLGDNLKKQLKLDKAQVLLPKNGDYYAGSELKGQTILLSQKSEMVRGIQEKEEIFVKEEIDRKISDALNENERRELEKIKDIFDKYDYSLAVPIISDNKLIAILLAGQKLSGEIYSQEDIKFFELLSPQLATAISRAYLYLDLENRVKELTELYQLTHFLSKTISLEKSLNYVMDAVVKLTGCDRGLLYLIDKKNKYLYTVVGRGEPEEVYKGIKIKIEDSILQKVIFTKKPLIVRNVDKTPMVAQYAKERLHTKAFIAVPMTTKDQVVGVIGVDNKHSGRSLKEINISLLQTLAGHAAIAVEDFRLYEELNEFNRTLRQKVEKATAEIRKLYEMKGEFLDIASHQLRTPVSVMIGTLDMLREGTIQKLPKAQQQKFIDNAFHKGRKLEAIINDILNASEMDTGKFDVKGTLEEAQIEDLAERVMANFDNEAADKKLEFILYRPKKKLPKIIVSTRYLEQAIGNLIDNALKYTKAGSIKVGVSQKNNDIIITVKDTGIGIPRGEMPKLFHKFVRANNARNMYTDGSGLGLFIVKKIIDAHPGGKIWVESEEGIGSSFYISLPIK